ncbi:C-type lectin domain family 17, member A-like [Kryptolebias marmoratus]|uniref:C-type lectin domain family 17, member A-like n=1 Tax=Kryptolebias marmoratus TaxID=37003 RepID=UPI000D530087|nr:C-type lectin domain family 17, member A-like [Kryptolebias marmoratus]
MHNCQKRKKKSAEIVSLLLERQTDYCQSGWLHFQSSCYMIGKSSDQKTWEEARDNCRQSYADLIVIGSEEEQDFIYKSSSAGLEAAKFWIGLRVEDGGWKWVNGKGLTDNYWLQPPTEEHHCAISTKQTNGWKSVSCDVKNAWICQKKAMSG